MTRPNNITTNYTYDTLSRLLSVLHQAGGSTIDGDVYTLDAAGNRTAKQDDLAGVTSNYTYDKIYELTQGTQGTNTTESYSYDAGGNRLSSLGVSPYSYNTSNELTSTPSGSYTYDYNGNTLTDASGRSYAWDFENRLTQVTMPSSGGTATFKYDPFGRRIQKVFTQNSTTTTTNYLYDGDNAIETVDQNGSVLSKFAQGQNIDEPLAESVGGATYDYEQDGLGSVTSLTNSSGTLSLSYTYDSFGKITASSGSASNPFRYTGRDLDSETGLYYYRARYYDSSTGRFLSEDAARWNAFHNFYEYVNNNAVNLSDPFGLIACSDCQRFLKYCYLTGGVAGFLTTWGCRTVCISVLKTPLLCWTVCPAGGAAVAGTLDLACYAGYKRCKKVCKGCSQTAQPGQNAGGFGGQPPQTGGPIGPAGGGGGGGIPW